MQVQATKHQAQAEQAIQKAAEQEHKLQTTRAQVQDLQTLLQSQQAQLTQARDQATVQARDLQDAQAQAKQLQEQVQVVGQQASDLQTSRAAVEASHHAELGRLRQDLALAQQQLQAQEASIKRLESGQRTGGRDSSQAVQEMPLMPSR